MRVCYFVTEYPAISQTFIRREIVEMERNGISILRVSLRGNDRPLVDPDDIREKARTRYILDGGKMKFIAALAAALVRSPMALAKAASVAIGMMRRSSRPAPFHLIYLAEALVLAHWVIEEKVQHIHTHYGTNGAEVAMLCHLLTGVPYSFTVHGSDEFDRPEYLGLPAKVKHAAFVGVVSSFTGGQLRRWLPVEDWHKLLPLRCGLAADFLNSPQPRSVPKSRLVAVGRLSREKGHLILIQALAILMREGVPFELTLAGDGPLRPQLERAIRDLGLERHVELAGWMNNAEVRVAIQGARALVLPSFMEGVPIVLMEAMALGRPVIATHVGGIPELVADRESGWLVPAGSPERLADAIRQCLNAPDAVIRAMGASGRDYVRARHDITREVPKLAALFKAGAWEDAAIADGAEAAEGAAGDEHPAYGRGVRMGELIALRSGHSGWMKG